MMQTPISVLPPMTALCAARIPRLVLALVGILLCAGSLQAAIVETFYVSPTGADFVMRDGKSPAQAWATLSYALSRGEVTSNDIIMVQGDGLSSSTDFIENVVVNKSVRIRGDDSPGAAPRFMPFDPSISIFQITADNVEISDLEMHGVTSGGAAAILVNNATGCVLDDNVCGISPSLKNSWGIIVALGGKNILSHNQASYNTYAGIYLGNTSANVVDFNTCAYNGAAGLLLSRGSGIASANLITGNEFNNNPMGITIDSIENVFSTNLIDENVNGTNAGDRAFQAGSSVWVHNQFRENQLGIHFYHETPDRAFLLNNFSNAVDASARPADYTLKNPFPLVYEVNGTWYSGFLGNEFITYAGSDADGDGVGDTAHTVSNVRDDHPVTDFPGNYSLQAWSLARTEGANVLLESEFYGGGEILTLGAMQQSVFRAPSETGKTVTFSGGTMAENSTWGGWFTFASPLSVIMTMNATIGYSDPNGNNFVAAGPTVQITGDGSSYILPFSAPPSTFDLPPDKSLAVRLTNTEAVPMELMIGGAGCVIKAPVGTSGSKLYYPYVAASSPWSTQLAVVNTIDRSASGQLKGYDENGTLVLTEPIALPAHGRKALVVAPDEPATRDLRYCVLESDSEYLVGYTLFTSAGVMRGAVPAVSRLPMGEILVPHVGYNDDWWTGLGVVNDSPSQLSTTLRFNNGSNATLNLGPKRQMSFPIQSLFMTPPSGIESATGDQAPGVLLMELFGSGNMLAGVGLTDWASATLYYPHVAPGAGAWWTGLAAYNAGTAPTTLTITAYAENGTSLATVTRGLAAGGKFLDSVQGLGLPSDTAWVKIEGTEPLSGMELFGTADSNQLAGFSVVNFSDITGVLPRIDDSGWTGIALVNTQDTAETVTLTAYDDSGTVVATTTFPLAANAKVLGTETQLFGGQDVSQATYVAYTATAPMAAFQLCGSTDSMLLDALPALRVIRGFVLALP